MRVQARRAANTAAIAANWPRGYVVETFEGPMIRTRGGALMDAIWRRSTSQTMRGAIMLKAAWHLHRARYADTRAVAAYELERAADARRALMAIHFEHEALIRDA